jgi:hypothetical protein
MCTLLPPTGCSAHVHTAAPNRLQRGQQVGMAASPDRPAKRRLMRRLRPGEYVFASSGLADEPCMCVDESGNHCVVVD